MQEHAIHWERSDNSRVPFAVYTQEATHQKELERLYFRAHWGYVGLEPEAGRAFLPWHAPGRQGQRRIAGRF